MRWFRTITLVLLTLLVLLIAIPGVRWFQTRQKFVPAAGSGERLEWAYAVVPAPKMILLPRIVPAAEFNRGEPIDRYLAEKKMMAGMEKYRIEATGHYDLRPYLADAGMTILPEAVAVWDADSGMALLKLPKEKLEEARLLVGREFDEWEQPRLEFGATLVAVDRGRSVDFLTDFHDLTLEWLTGLPPEKIEILHSIGVQGKSGMRAKAVSGEPDSENEEKPGDFVELEIDPVLGTDNLTIDVNFAYEFHRNHSGEPLNLKVTTLLTLSAGHSAILELGTGGAKKDEAGLIAYYLILRADRISSLGKRTDPGRIRTVDRISWRG